ncbi:MAG: electron transfer flavoprotein subunit alpha/FixB family protein [Acidimicrobiales bacterium]
MTVLVLLEHDRGEMVEAAREALTSGRELAAKLDSTLHALLVGADAQPLTAEVGRYGAEIVHVAEHELLTDYGPDAWAETVGQLAEELDADAVMSVGTDRGNEVMAQLAAGTDLPFVANCASVNAIDDDRWTMTRIQWGGSLLEDVTLEADRKLITFGHHAVVAEPVSDPVEPTVEQYEPDLGDELAVTLIRDRVVLSQGVTLSTSPVVISGGRGVGSAEGFAVLEELAELLGGRVGCSRAVTNNGWRPHSDQVGQTGTRIAPEIYIATGISGAIQHWVGAMASKKILAINTDPEANMVTKADYAVLGDLHKVVPAISAEIRRRRSG